ncbi:MAG: hypothetical protein RIE14_09900 [Salinisphaeraceae bacterium]
MIARLIAASGLLLTPVLAIAAGECERMDRTVVYKDQPVTIYASNNQYAEVVFPEALEAILPEQPKGLEFHEAAFPDRLFFSVENDDYHGIVILQTASGETYRLKILAREGCSDATVSVQDDVIHRSRSPVDDAVSDSGPNKQRLMKYMLHNETPPSYRRVKPEGSPSQRLVMKQGTVFFYLEEVWRGPGDVGMVLLVVNKGRVPYRVDLQGMDFSSERLRAAFGRVREITMMPTDFRLAPSPEYASDNLHAKHQGLIYIVANQGRSLNGR